MNKIADLMMTLDYGPSPENDDAVRGWLASHSAGFGHFIAGRFTKPGELFDVFNPAKGETIARVTQGAKTDVDAAVAAARKALPAWSALPGDERARHLYALARHRAETRTVSQRARNPSTTASRSAKPATSTCRWSRGISIITPAGPRW